MTSLVVTGIGALTPLGIGTGADLVAAARAARRPAADPDGALRVRAFEPETIGEAKDWRRMSRSSILAVSASLLALRDAGAGSPGDETAVVVGTRYGCLSLFEEFHRVFREQGPRAVSPTVFSTGVLNAPGGHLSVERGIRGPCHTIVGGEAVGLEALAVAANLLLAGAARRAVAVGVEEAPTLLLEGLRAARGRRSPGEGAVALVLEAEPSRVNAGVRGAYARLAAVALGRPGRGRAAGPAHAILAGTALARAGVSTWEVALAAVAGTPGALGAAEAHGLAGGLPSRPTRLPLAPLLGDSAGCLSAATAAVAAASVREAPVGTRKAAAVASAPSTHGASGVAVFVRAQG
ncbi:MAG: hypothetical protein L0216_16960 [Planctomycetales bacterium]|nr:hypothetical protein [Planctomycetales bacterium]